MATPPKYQLKLTHNEFSKLWVACRNESIAGTFVQRKDQGEWASKAVERWFNERTGCKLNINKLTVTARTQSLLDSYQVRFKLEWDE